jgi:hypothetical protein
MFYLKMGQESLGVAYRRQAARHSLNGEEEAATSGWQRRANAIRPGEQRAIASSGSV